MTPSSARSLRTVFTVIVVVGLAASLVGCASVGSLTPVEVTDVKSVAGRWDGVVYQSGSRTDYYIGTDDVTLTIREDGSYDVESSRTTGISRGKGQIVISQGRLILRGERGQGVGTVLSSPGGDRVMSIDAVLTDNSILKARLSPSR
jgi:hypothetical protein